MKRNLILSFISLFYGLSYAATPAPEAARLLAAVPLHFEPAAQTGRFLARSPRAHLEFEGNRVVFRNDAHRITLQFAGASSSAKLATSELLRSRTNLYLGNDRSKWRTGIPNYARLEMHGLYEGVDVAYYGNAGELEYDLLVKAGADPGKIRLRFTGVSPHIDKDGNLTAGFVQRRPDAYQLAANGTRLPIQSGYRRNSDGTFGFSLGNYDRSRPLVIDPVVSFSAYIYGSGQDVGNGIGHDGQGLLYIVGTTSSTDLPVTGSAEQSTLTGTPTNVFIAVLDPTQPAGSQVVYLSYFGGTGADTPASMTVDKNGDVYVVGTTTSTDFPTANPAQLNNAGGTNGKDAFVFWLIPSQAGTNGLYFSSYLGGTGDDVGYGVAVDSKGIIYVTGDTQSSDFPVANAYQGVLLGTDDAFLVAIDPSKSLTNTLVYSTYFGGGGADAGRGVAVAPDGSVWLAGSTVSPDLPITGYSFQPTYQPGGDGFLAQFTPLVGGYNSFLYGTFIGGSAMDIVKKVICDPSGTIIVAGDTISPDLPVTSTSIQPVYGGSTDAFISVINPSIITANRSDQLVYSTYYGGSRGEATYDLKEDANGIVYLTGTTVSPNLEVTPNALQPYYDLTQDLFILKLDVTQAGLNGLDYSTYVGSPGTQIANGIDVDSAGNIYVTGYSSGPIFDPFGGVPKPTKPGKINAFILGVQPCSYSLSFTSEEFPDAGGMDTIGVNAPQGCSWTAASNLSWVTLSPAGGTGNGSVQITIAPNTTGAQETGNVTVAGQQFAVTEDQ